MTKEEQTPEVKVKLYDLTRMFVRAYQPKLYKQFRGELDDLASEFYLQFLTEKARVKGKEESLLDKFDPSVTTLAYLVKISVQRMLIDRSRKDKREVSLDEKCESFGDMVLARFNLIDEKQETIDDFEATPELREKARTAYLAKSESEQKAIAQYYRSIRSVINEQVRALFSFMDPASVDGEGKVIRDTYEYYVDLADQLEVGTHLRVYQVTEKSIQLLHGTTIVTYNKETGAARGKNNFQIMKESLEELLKTLGDRTFKLKIKL